MEQIAQSSIFKTYLKLTKPGIIFGNAVNAIGGFLLASKGSFDLLLMLKMLFGLSLVIASGCVSNNYIDRDTDKKMTRTKNRPFPKSQVLPRDALIFSAVLGSAGVLFLAAYTNYLAAGAALFGLFVYVMLYSFIKYFSTHGTLIGSVAGAMPPVIGYVAVSGRIDIGALFIFTIIALWQMPHFFAISIYRLKDYAAAGIPVLPVKRGVHRTKVQIILYLIAFLGVIGAFMLEHNYLIAAEILGVFWLVYAVKGFRVENDAKWARKMFVYSLIIVMVIPLCLIPK